MKYPCPRCRGRGWLPPKRTTDFPDACAQQFSGPQLAKLLRLHRRDVYRVENLQAGTEVSERVLAAIARVFPGELGIVGIKQRVANL